MDYARFNYVAQPGDQNIRFIRQMGPYDYYTINWGYRWIPNIESPEQEKKILDSWISEKVLDPMYSFGSGSGGFDPAAQTENIGDDPVKASTYGLNNLRIVSDSLVAWTTQEGMNYADLQELYDELVKTWGMYSRHVLNNIGGIYQTLKRAEEEGHVYDPVPAEVQAASMKFLLDQVITTPNWLINENILRKIEPSGEIKRISDVQNSRLDELFEPDRLVRMIETKSLLGKETYSYINMMDDLRKGIWSDLNKNYSIDIYRRNLQISWINKVSELLYPQKEDNENEPVFADISAIALYELESIKNAIQAKKDSIRDTLSRSHFLYCLKRIENIMEPGDEWMK
jgi:hypothetical protein